MVHYLYRRLCYWIFRRKTVIKNAHKSQTYLKGSFAMPRAPARCGPTCPKPIYKYGKCRDHQPVKEAWKGSKRSSDFIKSAEWERQRRRIIFREKGFCQVCGGSGASH